MATINIDLTSKADKHLSGMKYIVAKVIEDDGSSNEERKKYGLPTVINSEEEAIQDATKAAKRNPGDTFGVYKLIKKVEPPSPTVKDVE
jgi:hypothetical protein